MFTGWQISLFIASVIRNFLLLNLLHDYYGVQVTADLFDYSFRQSRNKFIMSGPVGSGSNLVCSH